MDEEYLKRLGLSIARGVPQMATGFVDLAALPFTMTGLLDDKDVVGSTAYLTEMGLLPPPQEGVLNETAELVSGAMSPGGALKAGLLGLGTMAGVKGGKSINQAIKTAQDEAMEIAQRNAALPIEQGGLGLPPDNTAMDRARALGFDVDNPMYHGTKADIEAFDLSRHGSVTDSGDFGKAVYSSPEAETASRYATSYTKLGEPDISGANVLPLLVRPGNQLRIEGQSGMEPLFQQGGGIEKYVEMSPDEMANLAKSLGYDSIRDFGYPQLAVFDPSRVRSRFAAFDPMKRNLPDILAGVGATGIGLGLLTPTEEEQY